MISSDSCDPRKATRESLQGSQYIWIAAHDSAVQTYGEGERAHRTPFVASKHIREKMGGDWSTKINRGSDDPAISAATDPPQRGKGDTHAHISKKKLYEIASRLHIPRRSLMNKKELAEAIRMSGESATTSQRE